MSNCEHIVLSLNQQVLQIGIHRPEKKNALTAQMYLTISEALLDADNNPSIKAVLLHGNNDTFSAGTDLSGLDNRDPSQPSPVSELLAAIHAFKKPIVASVSGLAIGIGATILLHCDLVYAAPDTRFRMPFINLGTCPEAASSLLLPATAGLRAAAEVLLLGDFFSTDKAIELGIVNASIDANRVFDHALEKACQLAQKPGEAMIITKQLLKHADHAAVKTRITEELKLFNQLLLTPESIAARSQLKTPIKT